MSKILKASFLSFIFSIQFCIAQQAPLNWFLLDPAIDSYKGTATNSCYDKLLQEKVGVQVIVAVIDGGVDIFHPDLIKNIWTNEKEIPGNGIDDDKNGFVDDVHGWDFIGGKDGNDVNQDNYELTRVYRDLKKKYGAGINGGDPKEYEYFLKIQSEFNERIDDGKKNLDFFTNLCNSVDDMVKDLGKNPFTSEDLKNYNPTDNKLMMAKIFLNAYVQQTGTQDYQSVINEMNEGKKQYESMVNYGYNLDFDPRNVVGDNYSDVNEKGYGNNEVQGPDGLHGTHVSGIIGAVRNNNLGMDGVGTNKCYGKK